MLHLYFYVGISGSGKSSIAAWRATNDEAIISSDIIRAQLWGDATDQQHPEKVFDTMFKRVLEALKRGQNVHYDATNLAMRHRLNFIKNIRQHFSAEELELHCIIVAVPIEECLGRNAERERHVPEEVIWRQAKQFQCPVEKEGWTDIEVVRNTTTSGEKYQRELVDKVIAFGSQKNSHHTLNLAQHSLTCMLNMGGNEVYDNVLLNAAYFHDFGKVYTQAFWEKDNYAEAHYPGHAELGSYIALAADLPLRLAQLICYHMVLFGDEAAQRTWHARLGDEMWNDLIILHGCDEEAK